MKRSPGVLFDMDGVLVDSERAMMTAAIESLARYGVKASFPDFTDFVGMGEDRFVGGVAEKHGVAYVPEMKDYAYEIYVRRAKERVNVFPHAREVLERLKRDGYLVAVASAADRVKVNANLACVGVSEDFFDALVTGSEVTRKKPDPEIYVAAAKKLRLRPEDCIVVEDAVAGIAAAKGAGSAAVGVTTSFPRGVLIKTAADFIAADLLEAREKIEAWRRAGFPQPVA